MKNKWMVKQGNDVYDTVEKTFQSPPPLKSKRRKTAVNELHIISISEIVHSRVYCNIQMVPPDQIPFWILRIKSSVGVIRFSIVPLPAAADLE